MHAHGKLALTLLALFWAGCGGDSDDAPSSEGFVLEYQNDFESGDGWTIFEEIVGENPCYGAGIGEVAVTGDVSFNGTGALRVWANKSLTTKSNHVIGAKEISKKGVTGVWRYELSAYIDSATIATSQTGPEFSLQSTREISPGVFRTMTAGCQYRSNPFLPHGEWAVWIETAPNVAMWIPSFTQPLTHGVWYHFVLEVDYNQNRYVRFSIQGPDVDFSLDMNGFHIAQEIKWTEEAYWISAESENLWSDCTGVYESRVYYDRVKLFSR